jgi:hypothetical protein
MLHQAAQDRYATLAQTEVLWRVLYIVCNMAEKLVRGMQAVDPYEYNFHSIKDRILEPVGHRFQPQPNLRSCYAEVHNTNWKHVTEANVWHGLHLIT